MNGVNEHVTRRSQQKIKKDERETEKKGEVMGGLPLHFQCHRKSLNEGRADVDLQSLRRIFLFFS